MEKPSNTGTNVGTWLPGLLLFRLCVSLGPRPAPRDGLRGAGCDPSLQFSSLEKGPSQARSHAVPVKPDANLARDLEGLEMSYSWC